MNKPSYDLKTLRPEIRKALLGSGGYFTCIPILKKEAVYNVLFGERSNGKTTNVLLHCFLDYWYSGRKNRLAVLRRWADDFVGKRGQQIMSGLLDLGDEHLNIVEIVTEGEWNSFYYYSGRWYLCVIKDGKRIDTDLEPWAWGFSISTMEHDKQPTYNSITNIFFDEFISRSLYLQNEFVDFMNVLSTIIRTRTNVKIFMVGNSITRYCPYFTEMGLTNVKKMSPGDIDFYKYGESKMTVAIHYAEPSVKKEASNSMYFAFNNPKLKMITNGSWEMDFYPHCPIKYKPKDVKLKIYVDWKSDVFVCECVSVIGYKPFLFVYRKTTDLEYRGDDIVCTSKCTVTPNHLFCLLDNNKITKKVHSLIREKLIFFSDNDTGDAFTNYLQWASKSLKMIGY